VLAELSEMEANGATGTAEYADKKRELARASLDCQNSQMGLFRTTRDWIAAGLDAGMSTDALTAQVYALRDSGVLTAGQVAALIGQINAIPPGKSVTISTNIPQAQAQFWSFNQEMDTLFPGGNKWLNLHITETGSGAGRHLQYGGWIRKPEMALIGEAGTEFVLSSAMLQGQAPVPPEVKTAVGGKTGAGTTIIINNPTFLTGNRASIRELARNVKMAMDEDGLR